MPRKGKKILSLRSLYLILLLVNTGVLTAQSKSELETRKLNTQKEIDYTNRLLEETKKNRLSTLNRVRILNTRIRLRNDLISSIDSEVILIDREIVEKEKLVENLETDLVKVRAEYERLIIYAYWNRSNQDRLMFVLSAENFNQAYKRMKYIQQFTKHRKAQAMLINSMRENIIKEVEALEEIKVSKEALALEKRNESRNLQNEISENNREVGNLQKRERELKNQIAEKIRIADKLEKEIAEIIAEEARRRSARNLNSSLTPEEKLISNNFQGNKGKLPWPTERGIITGKYGKHRHPVLKQVTTQNDGIDISTVEGAEARAIFEGVVSRIIPIPGANLTVIIRHGNFLTVYQGVVDVRVKKGDKVEVKQVLGKIFTEKETSSTILHIEIWQEMDKQNPEDWLSRSN